MRTKMFRFSILDLYFRLICVFPLLTTLVDGTAINKILFAGMFLLHVLSLLTAPMKKKTVLLMFFFAIHYVVAVGFTDFPLVSANLLVYFPYYLLYTYFMIDNQEKVRAWIVSHKSFIQVIVRVWTMLVLVSVFVPSCYYIKEGGGIYFGSWCDSIFRLGPSAVFVQVLAIFLQIVGKDKYALLYMLVPLYCGFMGSSRTYFLICLCLFAVSWYIFCDSKKKFWISMIPMAMLLFVVLYNSSMWNKLIYSLDAEGFGGFWYRFTSSRSVIWSDLLTTWGTMPIYNRLLGCGIDFTLDVAGVWGHNDFVELICNFGLVGVLHYIYVTAALCSRAFGKMQLPFYMKLCVLIVWFFNAFFNMHYVYFCAMLSYPILLIVLEMYQSKSYHKKLRIRFV